MAAHPEHTLEPHGLECGWRSMIHAGTWEGEAKTTESLSQSGVYKTLSTHKFIRIWACMIEHTRGIRVLNPNESPRTPFLEFERKSTGKTGSNAYLAEHWNQEQRVGEEEESWAF